MLAVESNPWKRSGSSLVTAIVQLPCDFGFIRQIEISPGRKLCTNRILREDIGAEKTLGALHRRQINRGSQRKRSADNLPREHGSHRTDEGHAIVLCYR